MTDTTQQAEQTEQTTAIATLPEIAVSYTPAVINVNFEQLEAALTKQVEEQSKTVVTEESLKAGKALAASMKKTADAIKAARIEYAKKAGVDISIFETRMKALEQIALDGRAKIDEQNKRFDEQIRAKGRAKLAEYLAEQMVEKAVDPEFQSGDIEPLVSLTNLTAGGALTKGSRSAVDAIVNRCLSLQNQTKIRLMELENASYRAGLSAPLNRGHVEMFLFAEPAEYQQRLGQLMATELEREKVAQETMRKKLEAEAMRAAEQARKTAEAEEAAQKAREQAKQQRLVHEQQLAEQAAQNAAEQARLREQAEGNARPIFVRGAEIDAAQDDAEQQPESEFLAMSFGSFVDEGEEWFGTAPVDNDPFGEDQFVQSYSGPADQFAPAVEHFVHQQQIDPMVEHKRACNRQIVDALAMVGINQETAVEIIKMAIRGQLGALKVIY